GAQVLDVDRRIVVVLEGDVGQPAAVRAPVGRHQRFGRAHHHLRVVAIGVGNHQRVIDVLAGAGRGHVGDAGPERAAHAEDLLVDGVGDLVADVAHGAGAAGHGDAEQALLLGHVEQLVFHAIGTAAGVDHAADHQEVLLEHAPGRVVDLAA